MPTQTETATVFRSRDPNLTLVRRPGRRRYNENGELELLEGVRHHFENGELHITDPDTIEWLRKHRLYNRRFWEVGNEPGRIRPSVEEQLTEIAKAAARRDPTAIAAIYQQEVETHDREPVKNAANAAMLALEEGTEEGEAPSEVEESATEE